jgi:hypothetical protein
MLSRHIRIGLQYRNIPQFMINATMNAIKRINIPEQPRTNYTNESVEIIYDQNKSYYTLNKDMTLTMCKINGNTFEDISYVHIK